jgi:hypothetical protein
MTPVTTSSATPTELRRVSRRAGAVAPSATLAVDAKAKALQAAGAHVIGFGAGEPDFPTPAHIVEAAIAACGDPANHRYTPTAGIPALREAIALKTQRDSGFSVTSQQVLVTNGGKQAVANAFAVLCDPGDEVLVLAPFWTTYPEAIALAGGVPVIVQTDAEHGFRSSVEDLEAAWTPRTKALLFVSPSNPTGAVYPKDEVEAIGRWALDKGIWVLTDEIYEHLVYGGAEHHSMPVLVPELAERPGGCHHGGHQHPEPCDLQRVQCGPTGRAGCGVGPARCGGHDARRLRSTPPDHGPPAQRDRRGALHRARGRVLCLPLGVRRAGPVDPGPATDHQRRVGRAVHQ